MSPMIAGAAMPLSSFTVVTNALRLNAVKFWIARHGQRARVRFPDRGDRFEATAMGAKRPWLEVAESGLSDFHAGLEQADAFWH